MEAFVKGLLIVAVTAVVTAAVLAALHLRAARQPGPAPQLPAAVIYDGKTWDCAQVRQAWASGNMDQYDGYPGTVAVRCTA